MHVKHENSSTQIHLVRNMKKPFTTNWYINKMCLPSLVEPQDKGTMCELTLTFEETSDKSSSFGRLLVQAVDEGLSTFGEFVREAVYSCLEDTFGIRKDDIPRKVEAFSDALGKIFGDAARLLEIQIMKNLYRKVGDITECFPKKEDITFTEYVCAAEHSSRSK
jgi:hypothetical protein